jgi:hypothetical protein
MTFTVDSYSLNVTDFSESSEPVDSEWYAWESNRITVKRFTYGILRRWTLSCVEANVAWSSSAAKYLQDKMNAGEKVTFNVSEGDMHTVQNVQAYVSSVEVEYGRGSTASRFTRKFTVTLKEASPP